ncbi:MAG TPA: molybdenum cofactor biosynthesis protein MoaE [Gemmatimonadaceae bacterium]|nr:molybdenum cofactor biosynthesis protein MoaE [Gemmatimonadaceae bacterium]
MRRVAVVTRSIDPAAVMDEVRSRAYGAVSMFVGTVRDTNEGRAVSSIDYSAYVPMAEAELDRIVSEAIEKFGVGAVVVEHRIGPVELGDVSVAIAVAHRHRAPALEATSFLIERIKSEVPIWKLEHYSDGAAAWIDPNDAVAGR